jgi:hypothetical protein
MEDFDGAGQAFLTWLQQSGAEISPKIKLEDLRHAQAGRGVGKWPFPSTLRLPHLEWASVLTSARYAALRSVEY